MEVVEHGKDEIRPRPPMSRRGRRFDAADRWA
jgi:hypothetical protein